MQNKITKDGGGMDTPLSILKLMSSEYIYFHYVIINEVIVTGGKVQEITTTH